MPRHPSAAVLAALCLAGCTVGPDFRPPPSSTPPDWHDPASTTVPVGEGGTFTMSADPQPDWWTRFGDPELTRLIDRATRGNLDQKIAVQRILEARSTEISDAASGLPSLKAAGSWTDQQSALDQLKGQIGSLIPIDLTGPPPAYGLFEGALDASWEIDLFGKVRRSVEASKADTAALIDDREDALVSKLRGLGPHKFVSKTWTAKPGRFSGNPLHQFPGTKQPNRSSR